MNEEQTRKVMNRLADDLVPDDIDLWPAISKQMEAQPNQKRKSSGRTRQLNLAVGISLILVLTLIISTFTPAGQAFARVLQSFFRVVEVEKMPTYPPGIYQTSTPIPTLAAVLGTLKPTATSELLPASTQDPALTPCYDDLNGSACKIAWGEKIARFDAKQFPSDPEGLVLKRVEASTDQILMHYDQINGGLWLDLKQGIADEFPSIGGAPADAIKEVMVGEYPGQFVIGMFANQGEPPTVIWMEWGRYRLRWMEGDRWFEIDVVNGYGNYSERDYLIQLAESLVYEPQSPEIRTDYLTDTADTARLAGFIPLEPSILPEGLFFDHGEFNEVTGTLQLEYSPGEDGLSEVVIYQTPLDKISLSPELDKVTNVVGEEVEINGFTGNYYAISEYNTIVIWHTDELRIHLQVFINEWLDPRIFSKEQILEIANSVQ